MEKKIKAWAILDKKTNKLICVDFDKPDFNFKGLYAYGGFDGKNHPIKKLKAKPCTISVIY